MMRFIIINHHKVLYQVIFYSNNLLITIIYSLIFNYNPLYSLLLLMPNIIIIILLNYILLFVFINKLKI